MVIFAHALKDRSMWCLFTLDRFYRCFQHWPRQNAELLFLLFRCPSWLPGLLSCWTSAARLRCCFSRVATTVDVPDFETVRLGRAVVDTFVCFPPSTILCDQIHAIVPDFPARSGARAVFFWLRLRMGSLEGHFDRGRRRRETLL